MMKKISYYFAITALTVWVMNSCERDSIVSDAANFSDPVAVASGNKRIERGNITSFADLSKGVKLRTWTIPNSAKVTNLDGRLLSKVDLIHVQFDEPGDYEVRLQSEFEVDSVALDTTFNVSVLDYIETKLEIESIDAGFSDQTPEQITMYEGGTIHFKDISLGNPNRRKWSLPGGDPSSAGGISVDDDELVKKISVAYPTIGTYDLTLVSWRQYADGAKDTLHLKDYIKVIENIDPPVLTSITESLSGVIHLNYNLPVKITSNIVPNLILKADGVEVGISSAEINTNDNRVVDITPAVNIKSNQLATISYDGMGGLMRINDIPAEEFTDQVVGLYIPPNLVDAAIYGFEDGGTGWMAASDNVGQISFSDEQAASGNYSMRMEATQNAKWTRSWSWKDGSVFALEQGMKVTIEFKMWIDPSFTDSAIGPWIIKTEAPFPGTQFWTGVAGLPKGEWITINKESAKVWTVPSSGNYFIAFRFEKKGVVYIDDIKVYEPE